VIGLDTNILVRYVTQDDARQSKIANRLIETRCSRSNPGRVSQIVLCELTWVLSRAYGYDKQQLIGLLEQLLITAELDVENESLARDALTAWRDGTADYSDYLIARSNQASGCDTTYSFDRKLAGHPAVTLAKMIQSQQ